MARDRIVIIRLRKASEGAEIPCNLLDTLGDSLPSDFIGRWI